MDQALAIVPQTTSIRSYTMPSIGPMELIVVLAIALIVLGPKRLPCLLYTSPSPRDS